MQTLWQDLRYGARMLLKYPLVSLVVALSIGLGVGANTMVYTWMEGLILNPYPAVEDADRLVGLNTLNQDGSASGAPPMSYLEAQDWRERAQSFAGMAVYRPTRLSLRTEAEAMGEPVWSEYVSGSYFDVLGVRPALGRTFLPEEERAAAPVAVISHGFWQRRFQGDPAISGRRVQLNGVDVTIIGVAAQRFGGVRVGVAFDLWLPVTLQPQIEKAADRTRNRGDRWLQGFARLKPGVTVAQANAELNALALEVSAANGESPAVGATARLMRQQFLGSLLTPLFSALLVVTGLVLLIACANVANLLLARASLRRREIGIRVALGAKRGQIVRQLLTESLLLALLGGLCGLLIALWARDVFMFFVPPVPQPVVMPVEMNLRVVGFAFALTLATALIFGLAPALRASRPDIVSVLKDEGRGQSGAKSRLRSALVVAQITFSLVALVCAGLFLRSLREARTLELGFTDPAHVLLVSTDFNLAGLKEPEAMAAADRLLERARALPGVKQASFSTMIPLGFGGHSRSGTTIEGYTPAQNERMSVERIIVSEGYFETMGIPLARGRGITRQDQREGLRVAVVNEAFAARYWPGQEALGNRLDQGPGWATVVGVAKNSAYRDPGEAPYPVVYSALPQRFEPVTTLHVRTAQEPKLLAETLRREFSAINADLPFLEPRTLLEHISASSFVQFIGAAMLSAFGLLALLMSAVGLYGVLAYIVSQRQREIAIRLALGARESDVLRLALAQGWRLIACGLGLGLPAALVAGRLLRSQLPGVNPNDPLTFAAIAVLLAGVTLLACWLPARRAAKVDSLIVLRCE
ncbi:MAG: ABC transporter permease [Blastocatellia bacterium]